MSDCQRTPHRIGNQRLDVDQGTRSGGRVTHVTDPPVTFESLKGSRLKNLRDKAQSPMDMKRLILALAGDDTRSLLPPMLEGKKTVIREHGRIFMAKDPKNTALVLGDSRRFAQSNRLIEGYSSQTRFFDNATLACLGSAGNALSLTG